MSEKQKLRHRLWTEVTLIFVICVFAVTGCGGNEKRAEETPPEPAATETVATSTTKPKPTKKPEKRTEKPKETFDPMSVTKGDIEANFDEALKHVTICGKKVSFPLTLNKLGRDFTAKSYAKLEGETDYYADLYYKKNRVASITIQNGYKKGNLREKSIFYISFISDITPDLDFDICGMNFDTPMETLLDSWGEASECPRDDYRIYKDKKKKGTATNCIIVMGEPGDTVYKICITYRRK